MTAVQCPVCDYETDLSDAPGGADTIASALGIEGLTSAQVDWIEQDMGSHLATHTITDWVMALRMADAYIAKLETGLMESAKRLAELQEQAARPSPSFAPPPATVMPNGTTLPPPQMPAEWSAEYASPRERQEQRAALRKAGMLKPPTDTLVPVIATGHRPEGVVGRKF